jgi:Ca2+-binding RTX toxin-like protein
MALPTPERFGAEFLVNTSTSNSQNDPVVTALADGRFVVVWADASGVGGSVGDTSGFGIRAQVFNADGSKAGAELRVNTTTAMNQTLPVVTALNNGGFAVSWTDASASGDDTSGAAVRTQVFRPNGGVVGIESVVNTTTASSQDTPAIATLSDGRYVVAWTDSSQTGGDTDNTAVRARLFSANGQPASSEFLVNTTTAGVQYEAAVTGLSSGGFVVSWTDQSQTGGDQSLYAIRAQIYDNLGNEVGGERLLNATTTGYQSEPAVAALAQNGEWVAVWTDQSLQGGDTSVTGVRAQVFAADGTKVGAEFLVNTTTSQSQGHAAVTGLADGRFMVVWDDTSGAGSDGDRAIRGQVFTAGGVKSGSEFLVNTTTQSTQQLPSVSELADGRVVVSWTDLSATGGDTSDSAVRAQILDPRQAPVVLTASGLSDRWIGTRWNDTLSGGGGDDSLSGAGGRDRIFGGSGKDTLIGGEGADRLDGQASNDVLFGGGGADRLAGGSGRDILTGGGAGDLFVFNTAIEAAQLADVVQDFVSGVDTLVLDASVFAGIGAAGDLAAARFRVLGSGSVDASDRILYHAGNGTLFYDPDGSGAQARQAFAVLAGAPTLLASDIDVI